MKNYLVTQVVLIFFLLSCESTQQKTAKLHEKYRADSIQFVKFARHKMDSLKFVLDSARSAHGIIGEWIVKSYIDDAGKPLRKNYMTTLRPTRGVFSNNSSQNDSLRVEFLIDSRSFSFQMFEKNSDNPVKVMSVTEYDAKIDCGSETINTRVKNFSDRLHFNQVDGQKVLIFFSKNSPIRFNVVKKSKNDITSYQFTINSTEGFSGAINKLID